MLRVIATAESVVQRFENRRTEPVLRRHQHPRRRPRTLHEITDSFGKFVHARLVEDSKAHDVPVDVDRPKLANLKDPTGGQPGPRTYRVEPEVHRCVAAIIGHDQSPKVFAGMVEKDPGIDPADPPRPNYV